MVDKPPYPIGSNAFRSLILILAAAVLLRLPGLSTKTLWYDEAFAVLFSSEGVPSMVSGTLSSEAGVAADVHPLAYYSLLWIWNDIFGTSTLASRSLSALIGLGIVILGYCFAWRLFGSRAAWIAGLLLAISPFQIHYAQEIRMYALLAGLLVAGTWAFWEASVTGRSRYWVLTSLLSAGALYTHNLAALYLVPLFFTPFLMRKWKTALKALLTGLGAVVLYLPWLLSVPGQIARVHASYWIDIPGAADLINTFLTFVVGLPVPDLALPIALFLGILLGAIAALATVRGIRGNVSGSRDALWLAYLAFAPVALMFVISQFLPIYIHRAMLGAGAAFAIWLAWTLQSSSLTVLWRRTAGGIVAISAVLGLMGYYTYSGFPYAPFEELTSQLAETAESEEIVVHSNKISALPAIYYAPSLEQRYLADPAGSGSDTLAPATQRVLGLIADAQVANAASGVEGVWFIVFGRELEDYQSSGYEVHPALSWLRANFGSEEIEMWGGLQLHHFTVSIDA